MFSNNEWQYLYLHSLCLKANSLSKNRHLLSNINVLRLEHNHSMCGLAEEMA